MFVRMAAVAAQNSTCRNLAQGCVIADDQARVLSYGWSHGRASTCAGRSCTLRMLGDCVHMVTALQNALEKLPKISPELKVAVYMTHSPNAQEAEEIDRHNFSHVYYQCVHRDPSPTIELARSGIRTVRVTATGTLIE